MAKKRRFEQLQSAAAAPKEKKTYVDPLQQQVVPRLEEVGKRLEGKGRTLLYGLGAIVLIVIAAVVITRMTRNTSAAAQTALGKAIETSQAQISETGTPAGSTDKTFKTERERAEAAIAEFQGVVDKFGGEAAEKAKYFIAVNRLYVDRPAGISELESLSGQDSPAGRLAKFALAQTRVNDSRFDDAAKLLQELINNPDTIISKDTLNFELAKVYEKQDKRQEALDLYFDIAKKASEAKDAEGKAIRMSQTAMDAKKKVEEMDPERAKQIVEQAPESPFGAGMPPMAIQ
jgi:predicted negative regulator of RcsB-dependent stress response